MPSSVELSAVSHFPMKDAEPLHLLALPEQLGGVATQAFQRLLSLARSRYELIVLDTGPVDGAQAVLSLGADIDVLVPVSCTWAMVGMTNLLGLIHDRHGAAVDTMYRVHVVLTRHRPRLSAHSGLVTDLHAFANQNRDRAGAVQFRVVHARVHECTDFERAADQELPLIHYKPRSRGVGDYRFVMKELGIL